MSRKATKYLTIEQRVNVLERLDNGEKATALAVEYGVSVPAISYLKKNKENILSQKRSLEACGSDLKRKKYTGIEVSSREQSLYVWMKQKRDIGDPISGPILAEKARMFNEELQGPPDFKASKGFLYRFKKRHQIRALTIQGEKLSADKAASDQFCANFAKFCSENDYSPDQVYNADETGLYWKALPRHTLVTSTEREAPRRKVPKDRVSVMCCTNASGTHKIPLMVVGESKKPRCFKGVRSLPVQYAGQKSAWFTKSITVHWYKNTFLPAIRERHGATGKKVILLLDNAPCHPSVEELNSIDDICQVKYLPPNVTSLIQPMDQGIIEKLKKVYKRNLLRLILTADTNEGVTELIKKINLLNVCNFISFSWEEVSEMNIKNAWKKMFPLPEELPLPTEVSGNFLDIIQAIPGYENVTENEASDWLRVDCSDPGWRMLTEEEILAGLQYEDIVDNDGAEETDDTDENTNDDGQVPMGNAEMLSSLNDIIVWYQTRWDSTPKKIHFLEKLRADMVLDVLVAKGSRG